MSIIMSQMRLLNDALMRLLNDALSESRLIVFVPKDGDK